MMDKFDFLLGTWNLESNVPKSVFSEADTGTGHGTFKKILDDKHVQLDYEGTSDSDPKQKTKARGIFAWDEKQQLYQYFWFESSGAFEQATCKFLDNDTLFLSWHNSNLIQTFTKTGPDQVTLRMEHPIATDKFELVLEVIFTKQ
jgi:hypothetical protein